MMLDDIDRRILSELMKNSKMSDREIAKKLERSQPTITRRRAKLEKEQIIREYTLIPNLPKLGYQMMVITLLKYGNVGHEEVLKARAEARQIVKEAPFEMIMGERGSGAGYDGVTISYHKDYRSCIRFKNWLRKWLPLPAIKMDSFIIVLGDEVKYRPLTFSTLAKHLLTTEGRE